MKPEIHDNSVMQRVRGLVGELLEDDTPPISIAYALVYVAVEFGLQVEPDARRVLSTLQGAMACSTADAVPEDAKERRHSAHSTMQ